LAVGTGGDRGDHRDATGVDKIHERSGVDVDDVAHQPDVGGGAVDIHEALLRGEQTGILTGGTHRVRAVGVDQSDQVATDLAEKHHANYLHDLRGGHAEPALELALQAHAAKHVGDLRTAAVDHDRLGADGAQEHHVRGEGGLEAVIHHGVATVFDHDD